MEMKKGESGRTRLTKLAAPRSRSQPNRMLSQPRNIQPKFISLFLLRIIIKKFYEAQSCDEEIYAELKSKLIEDGMNLSG